MGEVGAEGDAARGFVAERMRDFRGVAAVGGMLPDTDGLPGVEVLAERAALAGLAGRGRVSAGGSFRAMPTGDGRWVGLSLARAEDVAAVPALTWGELRGSEDGEVADWDALEEWVGTQAGQEVFERALLLDIPVALPPEEVSSVCAGGSESQAWRRIRELPLHASALSSVGVEPHGVAGGVLPARPLVVDLSALWAGPLAAHLLGLVGARVVKVESVRRPDGARGGHRGFYDLLHGGHEAVAFDFGEVSELGRLRALLERADVVIEGSRPRALRRLGIDAAEVGRARAGQTWVSITAYGGSGRYANRPGFGDDVAFAAGLFDREADGTPRLLGDAIADPLTGVQAAVAALAGVVSGGGVRFDVAMYRVARHVAAAGPGEASAPAEDPLPRKPHTPAPELGAHTASVLNELGIV